jgi:hypothetical protein
VAGSASNARSLAPEQRPSTWIPEKQKAPVATWSLLGNLHSLDGSKFRYTKISTPADPSGSIDHIKSPG